MHPHRPTLTYDPDGTHVWSQSVTAPLVGLLAWSPDPENCDACGWATEPVTRTVLGEHWGGFCAFHHGYILGTAHAADWYPDSYGGRFGWRRPTRALAGVLLDASRGYYTVSAWRQRRHTRARQTARAARAARRAAREAARDRAWGLR